MSNLDRWLDRMGLTSNPFDRWNADGDIELPNYYIDNGKFDEFFQLTSPGIIFAKRGCGKTAQKQMIAAQCRPITRGSRQLAVSYTYKGFERTLESVAHDVTRIHARHHVHTLLYLGVVALIEEAKQDNRIGDILESSAVASQWLTYNTFFAPHLTGDPVGAKVEDISNLSSVDLLEGFSSLLIDVGLDRCVVLVDGLDEFVPTADPQYAITFLASLLGTLAIIECPGFSFKFFLPAELKILIESSAWFRSDRLRIVPIAWKEKELLNLIGQRLIHFSRREPKYLDLAEFCTDNLRSIIDREIVALAANLPRNVLILADKLIQFHSQEPDLADLISLSTWDRVKKWWRDDYLRNSELVSDGLNGLISTNARDALPAKDFGLPLLRIDEEKGFVWLGDQEVRYKIQGKVYSMLVCLYRHRGEVCTKERIVEEVWPEVKIGSAVPDQDIAATISRLRRILAKIAPNSSYIETIKGKTRSEGGYRLEPSGYTKEII